MYNICKKENRKASLGLYNTGVPRIKTRHVTEKWMSNGKKRKQQSLFKENLGKQQLQKKITFLSNITKICIIPNTL